MSAAPIHGTLATALDDATAPSELAGQLDLDLFRQNAPRGLGILADQFRWRSPALRYAIRLSLAMTTGLALTLIFPRFAHANWILLTIALITRANYSVTSQRRWEGMRFQRLVPLGAVAVKPPITGTSGNGIGHLLPPMMLMAWMTRKPPRP